MARDMLTKGGWAERKIIRRYGHNAESSTWALFWITAKYSSRPDYDEVALVRALRTDRCALVGPEALAAKDLYLRDVVPEVSLRHWGLYDMVVQLEDFLRTMDWLLDVRGSDTDLQVYVNMKLMGGVCRISGQTSLKPGIHPAWLWHGFGDSDNKYCRVY